MKATFSVPCTRASLSLGTQITPRTTVPIRTDPAQCHPVPAPAAPQGKPAPGAPGRQCTDATIPEKL
ncbi:hypothetical protein DV515_00003815 [Chloebia gouldiae]|uniref:Uncharacterized protein n=1 Tax=Chloebia gouldiae TaxID=44316 RepID=A0A3L8SSM5_CHLGU|nr:hypothetical protein DV515_00003815 [Chloebia gouldiae]